MVVLLLETGKADAGLIIPDLPCELQYVCSVTSEKENLRNIVPSTANHQFCCPGGLATASNAPCPHNDLPWSFYNKDGGFTENLDIDVR